MRVVVIGTGAGGSSAGWALAKAGHEVLFLERGLPPHEDTPGRDERAMHRDRVLSDDRVLSVNGKPGRLAMGSIPGGGTALYGAALVRPAEEEFQPGSLLPAQLPREIWDWPIRLQDLAGHFETVEDFLGVAGDHREKPPYLHWRSSPYPQCPHPLEGDNKTIVEHLRSIGLRPFQLPVAIDHKACLHCAACPGYLCPNGSRKGARNFLHAAVKDFGARVLPGHEALGLVKTGDGNIESVRVKAVGEAAPYRLKADLFILAAGAIGTTVLLERSDIADKSGQRGRNYMMHLGAGLALISRKPRDMTGVWHKQIGLSDFLYGVRKCPEKLGMVQSLPLPGPETLARRLHLPDKWAKALYQRTLSFVGTLEDLPQATNRITVSRQGVRIDHRFHKDDIRRGRALLRSMKATFSGAGAWQIWGTLGTREHLHAAHQVGTCRMHRSPKHGVVDGWGKVHGLDNAFVADGSVFPTALGVGPALTIYAWGLRVAQGIGAAAKPFTEKAQDPQRHMAPVS